jgi:prevent-host-death family protein
MRTVRVHEAKTHLSRLLRRVEKGEVITIARGTHPIARLVPIADPPRRPGQLKGKIWIAKDFDAPLPPKVRARFRGERG